MHEITGFSIPKQSSCCQAGSVAVESVDQALVTKATTDQAVPIRTSGGVVCKGLAAVLAMLCVAFGMAAAQQTDQKKKDDIPDAPSASRPFPGPLPPPSAPPPSNGPSSDSGTPPPNQAPPTESNPAAPADANSLPEPTYAPGVAPPTKGATPNTGVPGEGGTSNEEVFKISSNVNQVIVPVMVKDNNGRMVNGLLSRDFVIFEDGKKQNLNFFTTDPFALSVAILFDVGMPDVAVQKVNQTFNALEGAFSQFDEVSLYTYSSSVSKAADFAAVGKRLTAALDNLKYVTGRNNGPPVTSGPLGPQGPIINGVPMDQSSPRVVTPPKESRVLNDALVAAAMDLSKRDRSRRKVIFVISDGREARSNASYRDTMRVLLSNGIMVYGVALEGSAIPGYGQLQKLHVPLTGSRLGYSDILPRYASATGGEIFSGFSRDAIETTYAGALGEARNQYTLGYVTHATPSNTHREIEVRVSRPDLKISAKEGYYPVGIAR
jgi:VWFA-related protein